MVALEDKSISLPSVEGFSEKQLDDLQWAKEFMEKYERKHRRRL